jgi:hypothetical protein
MEEDRFIRRINLYDFPLSKGLVYAHGEKAFDIRAMFHKILHPEHCKPLSKFIDKAIKDTIKSLHEQINSSKSVDSDGYAEIEMTSVLVNMFNEISSKLLLGESPSIGQK